MSIAKAFISTSRAGGSLKRKKECLDELSYTDLLQFMQSKLTVNEYRAFSDDMSRT